MPGGEREHQPKSTAERIAHAAQRSSAIAATQAAPQSKLLKRGKSEDIDPLMPSNLLAWETFLAMHTGRQFVFSGMGEAVAYDYARLQSVFWFHRVPESRIREVFWKFKRLEPYGRQAMTRKSEGGSNGNA